MTANSTTKTLKPTISIFFAVLFSLSIILLLSTSNDSLFTLFTDFSVVFLNVVAVSALIYASYSAYKQKSNYWPWIFLSAGQFLFLLADIIYLIEDAFLNMVPFPSVADVFFILYYPFFAIGLCLLFKPFKIKLKVLIDILITLTSASLIFYFFIISPTIQAHHGEIWSSIFAQLYVFIDLIMLFVIMVLLYNPNKQKLINPLLFLSIAMFFQIFADLYFSLQQLTHSNFDYWLSTVLYLLNYSFVSLAAISFYKNLNTDSNTFLSTYRSIRKHNGISFFPLLLVIFTYGLLLYSQKPNLVLLWGVGIIVILVVIRQFIAIYEIKKAEESLKSSLKEKELMLKEIHHRVKNNLQIISSLLSLQSLNVCDEKDLELFLESTDRIKSMAMIHDNLYQSDNLSRINFNEYLDDLIQELIRTHDPFGNIKYSLDSENVYLGLETAIPCGLVANEIITNSMKHAFPSGQGFLKIRLNEFNSGYKMVISDNGIGLPDEIDFENSKSLGLQIIQNLIKQINGTLELNNSTGTEFNIFFEDLEYKKRF